jgi:hypothetical protein
MSEYTKSIEEFRLVSPPPKEKKSYLPKNIIGLEVATPLEQIITIIILVRGNNGDIIRVPIGWTPTTKVIKRMSKATWAEIGVEKNISRIRNSATRLAKSEYKKAVLKYSTYDMFDDEVN